MVEKAVAAAWNPSKCGCDTWEMHSRLTLQFAFFAFLHLLHLLLGSFFLIVLQIAIDDHRFIYLFAIA